MKNKIQELIKNPLNIMILIACAIAIIYFSILLYKEIGPKSWKDQRMECLKLGSDARARKCLDILNEK